MSFAFLGLPPRYAFTEMNKTCIYIGLAMTAFVRETTPFWFPLSLFLSSVILTLTVSDCVQLALYKHSRGLCNADLFAAAPLMHRRNMQTSHRKESFIDSLTLTLIHQYNAAKSLLHLKVPAENMCLNPAFSVAPRNISPCNPLTWLLPSLG